MLVFLSWSGARSRAVAECLQVWLSQVIQAVEPWISVDIEKGSRWGPEITSKLEKSRVGIICLTRDNLESRWILFEAGALSKTMDAYVCTLLLDVNPTDVEPPLSQFQHTTANRDDFMKLLQTINAAVLKNNERALTDTVLASVFETFWPALEKRLEGIRAQTTTGAAPVRPTADILDELLATVRGIDQRLVSIEEREMHGEIETRWPGLRRFRTAARAERYIIPRLPDPPGWLIDDDAMKVDHSSPESPPSDDEDKK